VVLLFAVSPSVAYAWSWGANYLSSTAPTNACPLGYVGMACSPFNNHPAVSMDKYGGDTVRLGFRNDPSAWYVQLDSSWSGTGIYVTTSDVGAPGYNRTYCKYQSGGPTYAACYSNP
jgi:hypothetical protein